MASTFALSLNDLETLANRDLAELAGVIAYVSHIELLAARQRRLSEAIEESAERPRDLHVARPGGHTRGLLRHPVRRPG
ncbi:hypothetical protein GCM10023148_15450 [Actinokineospora soli]